MKVKLFTHTDLDGIGCAIVARAAFGEENIDVTYCDYHDVNQKINEFVWSDEIGNYDLILITDISVSEQVAGGLNALADNDLIEVKLLDHHETAAGLNEYDWAEVFFKHSDDLNTSGTSMLFNFLYDSNILAHEKMLTLTSFVELVRRYDTWDWANIYNDKVPKQLNDLFYMYGRDRFIENVESTIELLGYYNFQNSEILLLELKDEEIQRYIEELQKELTIMNVGRYNIGVVFGEQHVSEVCHALQKANPQLDLIAMVNMKSRKVSYRTDHKNIDVGQFAKYFGGGGRKQTAGSQLDDTQMNSMLHEIFLK